MKNVVKILCVLMLFILIALAANNSLNRFFDKNTRVILMSNVENNKEIHSLLPKLKGDYIVTYDYEANHYTFLKIDSNLSLVDGKEYASVDYYKNKDYNQYLKLLANKFNIHSRNDGQIKSIKDLFFTNGAKKEFNEYFYFNTDGTVKTNINDDAKSVYAESKARMENTQVIIENNGKDYNAKNSAEFLAIFKEFGYDSNELVDRSIIKTFNQDYFQNKIQKENALIRAHITVVEPEINNTDKYYYYEEVDTKQLNHNIKYKVTYKDKILKEAEEKLRKEEAKLFEETDETEIDPEQALFTEIQRSILKDYKYIGN